MTPAQLRASAAALDPSRPFAVEQLALVQVLLEQAAGALEERDQAIALRDAALDEAAAHVDDLTGQLEAIAASLPPSTVERPLPDRVAGLLRALAGAVELLDPETQREYHATTLRRRRAQLLSLLPRLGPWRPAREARATRAA